MRGPQIRGSDIFKSCGASATFRVMVYVWPYALAPFAFATYLLSGPAFGQVYKCNANGKVIYQQQPCSGAEVISGVSSGPIAPVDEANVQRIKREMAEFKYKEKVDNAVRAGQIFVGMTANDVMRSWGRPNKVNTTLTRGSAREQWVYRRVGIGYDQYVYVHNGTVESIQTAD